jgi:tetratricopeptide (TPR) repeat protein
MARACLMAAGAAVVLGAASVALAVPLLRSTDKMWERALARDPGNERAVVHTAAALERKRSYDDALAIAEKCVTREPSACQCQAVRARIELRRRRPDAAAPHARAAVDMCPTSAMVHAAYGEVLAKSDNPAGALAEATRGVELLAEDDDGSRPWLQYVHALALDGLGQREEAMRQLGRAIESGAGREAKLTAANWAFDAKNLDEAVRWSDAMLADDPTDTDAMYNRALAAHHRGDYNRAREGYLAVLKLEPQYAVARFNLVVLTWDRGAKDEARMHARKFVEAYPDDPRGRDLSAKVGEPPR